MNQKLIPTKLEDQSLTAILKENGNLPSIRWWILTFGKKRLNPINLQNFKKNLKVLLMMNYICMV